MITPIALDGLAHPALRDLLAAWRAAAEAEGTSPPSRALFHPEEVKRALGRMMIVDREPIAGSADGTDGPRATHTYRYRLVGTDIVEMFGEDFTGKTVDAFYPALREMVREQFDRVFRSLTPYAARVTAIVENLSYDYEKLILPIRARSGGPVDQALVASFRAGGR